jgi:hypothetical protein
MFLVVRTIIMLSQNEIIDLFDTDNNATVSLLTTHDSTKHLIASAIKLQTDGPDIEYLSEIKYSAFSNPQIIVNLSNIYNKLKSLNDYTKIIQMLSPITKLTLADAIETDNTLIIDDIITYLSVVNPRFPIPLPKNYNDGNNNNIEAQLENIRIYLQLHKYSHEFEHDYFQLPTENIDNKYGPPEIRNDRSVILGLIFNIQPQFVWKKRTNYKHSSLLEEVIMNCLIKLNFDIWSYNLTSNIYVVDPEMPPTVEKHVRIFLNSLATNATPELVQNNIQSLFAFIKQNPLDKNVYYKFIKHISQRSIQSIDVGIEVYISSNINSDINLSPLLIVNSPNEICDNFNGERSLITFKNIIDSLATRDKIVFTPQNADICTDKMKLFLFAFRYKNGKIIHFDSVTNTIELLKTNISAVDAGDMAQTTINKFNLLKSFLNLSSHNNFFLFEALVKVTPFTTDECEQILKYALDFHSFVCTLLAAAIHYYNIGTIHFSIELMYNMVVNLPKSILTKYNTNNEDICALTSTPNKISDLNQILYQDFDVNLFNKLKFENFNSLSELLLSIKSMATDHYNLRVICSQYTVPELYLIKLLQETKNKHDSYTTTIIGLLLLNCDISEPERYVIEHVIQQNIDQIKFSPISGVMYNTSFLYQQCHSPIYKSTTEFYTTLIDNNVDISCDIPLLRENVGRFKYDTLFTHILNATTA